METLIHAYVTGLILYAALQLVIGNGSGRARMTVKWLNNRTFNYPSIFAVIGLSLLWFIVLPIQIYQHHASVVAYKRQRAARRREWAESLEGQRHAGEW